MGADEAGERSREDAKEAESATIFPKQLPTSMFTAQRKHRGWAGEPSERRTTEQAAENDTKSLRRETKSCRRLAAL